MALNLFSIPPGVPFLDALAEGWLREHSDDPVDIANGLILTPTRRAARSLAEAFLRISGKGALLLPRIVGLAALDEAPLTLAGALECPPAVDPLQRLAVLTHLILRMKGAGGTPRTADRAWILAGELATLMDEADRAEIDLAARLPDAADPSFAAHWARTLEFLHIVTHAWPAWLEEQGVMNPIARQVALLNAQAKAWEERAPEQMVVIAGTMAGIPAVTRLAGVVARLPRGRVILPVLDTEMSDSAWVEMNDSHPQSGLATLLAAINATRDDVRPWVAGSPRGKRFAMLSRALLPADALKAWRDEAAPALDGISRLKPKDPQEEAEAIAMILREAVETSGRTAALVTPDRDLALRVSAVLPRYGIIADDSAGEKLIEAPPAVLLRLLARAIAEDLAPVPLLALLKHPITAAGMAPATCRQLARALETTALRGPRPMGGLAGLRRAIEKAGDELKDFLNRVEICLEPALRFAASIEVDPVEALSALIAAAENLAATDTEAGADRLWAEEEGNALSTILTRALAALTDLPVQRSEVIPGLLDALLAGEVVRSRRATRGRGGIEHPRVFIWGLLEARLQTVDVIVLGGLAETVWPPAPEPGPWLSRPMRATVGLPSPEIEIAAAAHDFLAGVMAAERVILSCPDRRDGAPAVQARWLTRLEALLAGWNVSLPVHPAVDWARALDLSRDGPKPSPPPRPCPPLAVRPSRLSVTEIETWLRDPYAIYAKHILRLRVLKPLDQETDAADFGTLVHRGLHIFFDEHGAEWPDDAADRMHRAMRRALAESFPRAALAAWWEPRLDRIAAWVVETERRRREEGGLTTIAVEKAGSLEIVRPGRRFTLVARADRIERWGDGRLAILDYKTGQVPSRNDVEHGLAPQLPLEAVMAASGGFGPELHGATAELTYWRLTGGYEPGEETRLFQASGDKLQAVIGGALLGLESLIDQYDRADRCYLAQPHPSWTPRFSDYAQLARVAEWSLLAEEGEP
jgi:ATP-dependent helicase/nuclease subunit B